MTLANQLRWIIADCLLGWTMLLAPRDAGRADLAISLAPWCARHAGRSRSLLGVYLREGRAGQGGGCVR
jgi:hypothetical protein